MNEVSDGTLLGGQVSYRQFCSGHRSGFEPVLLAAGIRALPGELVLDAGTGAGAALLCLAHRIPGIIGIGAEIDFFLAALAQENFKNNGLHEIRSVQCNIEILPFRKIFNHIMANPPWYDATGTASPDAKRALAHQAAPGLLTKWIFSLTKLLLSRGTLTIIISATALGEAIAALQAAGCNGVTLLPLWPRAGQAAKQIIITATRGGNGATKILPGLILHDAGGITPAAQAILRAGQSFKQ